MTEQPTVDAETGTQDTRIADFWDAARGHLGWGKLDTVLGESVDGAVPPPAWSFGDDARLADELLALVLEGRKTATATALVEFTSGDEPLPRVGSVSIVLDSSGDPRALVRTTDVEVVPFDRVDAAHAAAEGEDDGTLESWRREHEVYWRRVLGADGFSPTMDVVVERFELVYPTQGPTPPVD
ncbi:ASCH domain-containing protein [Cellulomonas dongxiuzhuiae]|uniref:ASCH domain-containing protein n=1 Tax=Cellulomonas dongxiuzhuiae TaxID=2819979 RepID=A0ABX8GMC0_9CELL|nr:ASCH domain-containing protein [Cellulomonas dongxiuzhuiae]MBO3090219.1 ASCH domain-containing protein [Cellulomonas dongxiuzhuiae]MBO3095783.1 ASCH domain-containing protein [Cellulomonas dongxiuzhuiae]QWC17095.1 ASCH domain-containing protein [Cellulomonas dongxiuzhuiae]